jgi:hypothetical protein
MIILLHESSTLAFFSSVGATGPATRPALSLFEFLANSLYPPEPCFRSLSVLNPANPLIPRDRRYILPKFQRNCVSSEALSQIFWDAMHKACGDFHHILGFLVPIYGLCANIFDLAVKELFLYRSIT